MALQKKKGRKTIPADEQVNKMSGWLTTFLQHQEETRLKQKSQERHHAEELQILRDLLTSRANNNQNNN